MTTLTLRLRDGIGSGVIPTIDGYDYPALSFSPAPDGSLSAITGTDAISVQVAAALAAGTRPSAYDPNAAPNPTLSLPAYLAATAQAVSDCGITVNIGTTASPVTVSADTTDSGRVDVLGLMAEAALGLPLTWYQSTGNITITAAQLQTIALAIGAHRATCVALATALAAQIAAGTVATPAQIDAAAWPNNS